MVEAEIINAPVGLKDFDEKWLVVRRDEESAELWYYGVYDDEEMAYSVAQEIGNGVVLLKSEE